MKDQKRKAFSYGQWGETLACLYLRVKGYHILKRNLRHPLGEIDILAKRRNQLCFIEVKSRKNRSDALSALSLHQQKRQINAAKAFLSGNPRYSTCDIRFDLIAIAPWHWPEHIENAWCEGK
ncbi:YraN family protein [Terasakiella sp. SH-1]|uniref:YraN family protein n=1 Tax=Terasakiella sp. SH-1 TaxID=2560057 RepID=UPI0010736359|nr:YraN family protein [Terasakiella sp. SH-1]